MKHIIITNTPDSQGHIGPFDTLAQAKSYGEKHLKGAYALIPLTTPWCKFLAGLPSWSTALTRSMSKFSTTTTGGQPVAQNKKR